MAPLPWKGGMSCDYYKQAPNMTIRSNSSRRLMRRRGRCRRWAARLHHALEHDEAYSPDALILTHANVGKVVMMSNHCSQGVTMMIHNPLTARG